MKLRMAWKSAKDSLRRAMHENQLLTAGMWVGALGGIGSGLYIAGGHTLDMAGRAFFSSVEIRNKEDAFQWVGDWVVNHSGSFVTANRLQIKRTETSYDSIGEQQVAELQYEPGLGFHIFMFQGKLIGM